MSMSVYDDDYELVEIFGKQALFTNGRIDRASVPDGFFAYDLRHGDSGYPLTVEPRVGVNHAGTIIMTEPLDFSKGKKANAKDEYINIRGRLNFLGEHRTFEDFMNELVDTHIVGQNPQAEPCDNYDPLGLEDDEELEP